MIKRTLCAATLALLPACRGDGDLSASDVCSETASAVAAQALACSGDIGTSNNQAALFNSQYTCQVVDNDNAYQCAGYLRTAPCGAVLASSLEPLMKRWSPVCIQTVVNNPNSTLVVLPSGEAQADGTLNNETANVSCIFGTTSVTEDNAAQGVASVQANVGCSGTGIGFNLVFQGSEQPTIQNVQFPGVDTAPTVSQPEVTLNANSKVDTFGYFRANGAFTLAGTANQQPFQLSGNFDVVMSPPL
jgi:hypothetical protein